MKGTLKRIKAFCRRLRAAIRRRMALLNPQNDIRQLDFKGYFQALHAAQRGAISVGWLEGVFVGIVLLVILVTFIFRQGAPMLIEATSNTTALENAGADSNTINWAVFIGGAIVLFLFVGLLVIGIRVAMNRGGGGGGGGGGKIRWRRKR